MPESDVITEILSPEDQGEVTAKRAEELRVSAERMRVLGLARQLPQQEALRTPAGLK